PREHHGLVVLAMDRHRKRCDLAIGYIVSPALDNAQRTVFLEDGCRLVGVLLELLAVGSRHRGYESVDVGHDVSPVFRLFCYSGDLLSAQAILAAYRSTLCMRR